MSMANPIRPVLPGVAHTAPPEIEHLFQISLFLMIVTGFGTLAATGKLDLLSLVLVFSALLLRGIFLLRQRPFVISRRITSWLAVVYLVVFVLDFFFFSGQDFVAPAVHLVLFGICVKLFNIERDRDYTYLAVLSFLMVLSAAILTVDSAFLAAFALFLILAVFWFMATELRHSALDAANTAPLAIPGLLKRSRAISPLHRLSASLARTTAVMVAAILAAAALLFFAMPRISGGYLSRRAQSDAISSGFSDSVNLGEIGHIQQSSEVVAHIHIEGDTTGDRLIRLRGAVLTNFDGHRWSNPRREADIVSQGYGHIFQLNSRNARAADRDNLRLARGPQLDLLRYRVLMEPLSTPIIFTIPTAQALFGPFREIGVDDDQTFHNLDHDRIVTLYEGVSDVSVPLPTTLARLPDAPIPASIAVPSTPVDGLPAPASAPQPTDGCPTFTPCPSGVKVGGNMPAPSGSVPAAPATEPSSPNRYLQLPDQLDPRIPELAHQLTDAETTPYLRALAIERYLSTRYQYTLQLPSQPPADPIADFLFSRRRGHCEYFASSMAILLRTVGIPSRIITGFRGAQFNQLNANYIVRASDAHSWVEAYIPGAGWTTFDPTPAGDGVPVTFWTRYQLYLDAAHEFWREWIVNYDAGHQQALSLATIRQTRNRVYDIRRWWTRQYADMLEMARRVHHSATHDPRRLFRAGLILLALALLFALPYAILQFRARWRAGSPRLSPRSAASILYIRMTHFLARRGYSRAPAQTPTEFAGSIGDPALREAVLRFTAAYQHARFGGSTTEAATLPGLLDELRNLPPRP
jgi:transglutaminase-like putative cysteine protease